MPSHAPGRRGHLDQSQSGGEASKGRRRRDGIYAQRFRPRGHTLRLDESTVCPVGMQRVCNFVLRTRLPTAQVRVAVAMRAFLFRHYATWLLRREVGKTNNQRACREKTLFLTWECKFGVP